MSLSPRRLRLILGIACSSAAALIFEIALTRIFAVTQFYHFAFMAVSLALLGYGASGSLLAVFPVLAQPRDWAIFAFAQFLAAPAPITNPAQKNGVTSAPMPNAAPINSM